MGNDYVRVDARSIPKEPYNNAYHLTIKKNLQPGEYEKSSGVFSLDCIIPGHSYVLNYGTVIVSSNDTTAKRIVVTFEAEIIDIMSTAYMEVTNGKCTINYLSFLC
mgnify:CR=1 FL=1